MHVFKLFCVLLLGLIKHARYPSVLGDTHSNGERVDDYRFIERKIFVMVVSLQTVQHTTR